MSGIPDFKIPSPLNDKPEAAQIARNKQKDIAGYRVVSSKVCLPPIHYSTHSSIPSPTLKPILLSANSHDLNSKEMFIDIRFEFYRAVYVCRAVVFPKQKQPDTPAALGAAA
jgi:hypothetical protein